MYTNLSVNKFTCFAENPLKTIHFCNNSAIFVSQN